MEKCYLIFVFSVFLFTFVGKFVMVFFFPESLLGKFDPALDFFSTIEVAKMALTIEAIVLIHLAIGRTSVTKHVSLVFVGLIFASYRIAVYVSGQNTDCGCAGVFSSLVSISRLNKLEFFLKLFIGCIIGGSAWFLISNSRRLLFPVGQSESKK